MANRTTPPELLPSAAAAGCGRHRPRALRRRRRDGRAHGADRLVRHVARAGRAWPQSLETAVRIVLTSRQPMFVWWGEDLINLYNDAYRAILGGKHPWALGPARRASSGARSGTRSARAPRPPCSRNEGTYDEALLLIMERNGYPEETYYTFSYSPVPNDEGGTGGILCAEHGRHRAHHRRAPARAAARAGGAHGRRAHGRPRPAPGARDALATNPHDLPFAIIYLLDADRRGARAGGHGRASSRASRRRRRRSPLRRRPRSGRSTRRSRAPAALAVSGPALPARQPADAARGPRRPAALSPAAHRRLRARPARRRSWWRASARYRLFDDGYRGFLSLVGGQIAAGDRQRAAPTRRSAGAPRRWPSSTAPRRRSSPT